MKKKMIMKKISEKNNVIMVVECDDVVFDLESFNIFLIIIKIKNWQYFDTAINNLNSKEHVLNTAIICEFLIDCLKHCK